MNAVSSPLSSASLPRLGPYFSSIVYYDLLSLSCAMRLFVMNLNKLLLR